MSPSGSRWHDALKKAGPSKTPLNRWMRWDGKGVFARMMDSLASEAVISKIVLIDATHL